VFADVGRAALVGPLGSAIRPTVASNFLRWPGAKWGERVPETEVLSRWTAARPRLLDSDGAAAGTPTGRSGWLGGVSILMAGGGAGPQPPHFAWKEQHDGEELVVVRKGATPAFPARWLRGWLDG